jgi:hypothetical protein
MWKKLRELFLRSVWDRVRLGIRSVIFLVALWLLAAYLLEQLSYLQASPLRDWGSIVLAVLNGLGLSFVITALLRRLLEIINGQRAASLRDLGFIGYSYVFVIAAFAAIYLAADSFGTASFFHSNGIRSPINIVDHLYLSGITIATVGYGDIVPTTAPTKLLVVLEAIIGLWLTVTVLGVFIGSLLGRQLQDKQTRFFTEFQRDYFASIGNCQTTINSMEKLTAAELSEFRSSVLATIARLVRLHYEPSRHAKVNANWMRLYRGVDAPDAALEDAGQFVVPHLKSKKAMQTVWGVLVLQEWDIKPPLMPGKEQFALPVYDPYDEALSRYQLPGAPQAMSREEGYVIVSDVTAMDLSTQDEHVMRNLRRYFRERVKDLKSFASVRIGTRSTPYGVINIQSDELDLCGTATDSHHILVDMIQPFAAYLAQAGRDPVLGKEANKR